DEDRRDRRQRPGRAACDPGAPRARPRGPERRPRAVDRPGRAVPARRPDRPRADDRGAVRRRGAPRHRGRRPPGRAARARGGDARRRLPDQHHEHAHRVRGRRAARPATGGVGVERDDPGVAVRPAAGLRAGRRGPSAAAGVELRALEGPRRGDRAAVQPVERHPDRRPAVLEHHAPRRLRGVPVVLGRPAAAPVEPLGVRRREPRGRELPARPRGRHPRRGGLRHRRRRHGHAASEPGADGRGLPRRAGAGLGRGARHAARDRQGPAPARLRPPVLLAGALRL
ncbi:MAG: UDP-glucose 4-epimerase, partial [uncultured Thermoleophilia bacterium]